LGGKTSHFGVLALGIGVFPTGKQGFMSNGKRGLPCRFTFYIFMFCLYADLAAHFAFSSDTG
jgi:hypothetical protein